MKQEHTSEFAAAIDRCLDTIVATSSVAIVGSVNQNLFPLGSGTLMAVGDAHFVVTAGHVIRQAALMNATVGIAKDGPIFAATQNWVISGELGTKADVHDLALYRLTLDQFRSFPGAKAVRIGDVQSRDDQADRFYILAGYPAAWTKAPPGRDSSQPVRARMLVYGTVAYKGTRTALEGFDEERHFLLDARRDEMYDHSGERTSYRSLDGHPTDFPDGLRGISGCGVWALGRMATPPRFWAGARLVGIETAIYNRIQAIRATRWNSVTTLVHEAFPELRPVIAMYSAMHLRSD